MLIWGKCWVCEEIAGVEAMHLVRERLLFDEGVCIRHLHRPLTDKERIEWQEYYRDQTQEELKRLEVALVEEEGWLVTHPNSVIAPNMIAKYLEQRKEIQVRLDQYNAYIQRIKEEMNV